ncbi:MAG: TonB family protein [Bacteroidales bacterium]|nr:TonB family protein [Bacteroidales bacterium]
MNKKLLLAALLALVATTSCNSQTKIDSVADSLMSSKDTASILSIDPIEYEPEFPGGIDSLHSFIRQNLEHPSCQDTTGEVWVSLVIEKDGLVSNAKVIRSLNKEYDEEALRIVNLMPKWKPGYLMSEEHPVHVQYNLPIHF